MNKIKELRIKRNLTMKETAEALGIPYTTYVNYEKGVREPNSEMLIKISDFFDTSIDYLLGRDNAIAIKTEKADLPNLFDITPEIAHLSMHISKKLKESKTDDEFYLNWIDMLCENYKEYGANGNIILAAILLQVPIEKRGNIIHVLKKTVYERKPIEIKIQATENEKDIDIQLVSKVKDDK